MYFNGISALAHKFYNDPLLPLADPERLDKYIADLATALGWEYKTSTKEERCFSLPEQEFVAVTSRSINRKLHCIYTWGQSRGNPYKPISTMKSKLKARTRDIAVILALPDTTLNQVAESMDSAHTVMREAKNVVQKYLNVTLLSYHREQHHLGWWTRTTFAKNPIIWNMLTEIYTGGERVKKRAREVIGKETNG